MRRPVSRRGSSGPRRALGDASEGKDGPGLGMVDIELIKLDESFYEGVDAVEDLGEFRFGWVEALDVQNGADDVSGKGLP